MSSIIGMDRKEDRIVGRPRRDLSVTDSTSSINHTQSALHKIVHLICTHQLGF